MMTPESPSSSHKLFDLHVNGLTVPARTTENEAAKVVDFSAPELALESVRLATEELVKRGTDYFLATLVTGSPQVTIENLKTLALAMKQPWGRPILGVHLEGPFLSMACKGAHPAQYIRETPDISLFQRFFDAADGNIALTTISPALKGADRFIDQVRGLGVTVSLGHHDASTKQIEDGFEAGATGVTHAGNAWSKAQPDDFRRHTDVLAQLDADGTYVMVIPDGEHVSSSFIKHTYKIVEGLRPGHIVWVSDCSPLAGAPEGDYELYDGLKARIERGQSGELRSVPLTGSYLLLKDCLRKLREMQVVPEAGIVAPASINALNLVRESLRRCNTLPSFDDISW
jgi:N-acetylglucosamine-6-phosphate deacetylase